MKSITYTLVATMAAGATASHHHGHQHLHAKKGSKVQQRAPDVVTEVVVGATETVYVLGDDVLPAGKAENGLENGDFVIVGESTPTYSPPPPPPKPTTSKDLGAQFIESKSTPPPPPPPPKTTSTPPPPPASSKKPQVAQAQAASSSESGSGSNGVTGVNAKFPSGEIDCSEFPSQYGALPVDWLGQKGWTSLQHVSGFVPGLTNAISNIVGGISGGSCKPETFCSYACEPGYQKMQWPEAQGSTGQSVGGLWCNKDGKLELTNNNCETLCAPGVGGVTIQNDLTEIVSTCRTEYPGSEAMVIPFPAQPGGSVTLTNPDQSTYYQWQDQATSAQYYLNNKGLTPEEACVWDCAKDHDSCGNWAPIIIGVGRAKDGITYLSLFQNRPTSSAILDFNVEIKGDVNSKCSFINGQWTGGNDGCTTGMPSGGKAVIRFF
ncbi:Beta-glucosidase (SUN) [Lecanicillium sp. MT-2017a]|nr:Beta-glucosidase (SUN) [Lecanicillium sp. MT-2017a]